MRRKPVETTPAPAPFRIDTPVTPRSETALPPPPPVTLRPLGRTAWPAITLPAAPMPRSSGLDRATETRLRKGKRTPDARIDLHGMTAIRAHAALIAFITQSRSAGHRCVLVITGKGGYSDGAPGVLRREAPLWLQTAPIREMIVNVSPAHPRHGGGGALYVYLKRRQR